MLFLFRKLIMKNPFTIITPAEWYVLEALADRKYSDFGECTKTFMVRLKGVSRHGYAQKHSNAFTVSKNLVQKGLIITNTENQTMDDIVFITKRGLKLVHYGKRVEKQLNKIMLMEPTKFNQD